MDEDHADDEPPIVGCPPDFDFGGGHEHCTMFMPPLYIQRYTTVCRLLADAEQFGVVSEVLDIGCAEMTFLKYLKTVSSITHVSLLDISEETLRRHLHRAAPGFRDRLERRTEPLTVRVLCGDVTRSDSRLRDCHAVTGIEIIEHLEAEVLAALPAALFGYMRPRLVILTTPNAEFNQLFPDFSGMRHWDHKFEWTRAEFQQWCAGVVAQYPEYEVTFSGVGEPPAESQHLGCCSQLAVFSRRTAASPLTTSPDTAAAAAGDRPHQLLQERQFPFETRDTRLFNDVMSWRRQIGFGRVARADDRHRRELVSLVVIGAVPSVQDAAGSLDELVRVVRERGELVVMHDGEPHVVYQLSASSSDDEDEDEVERGAGDERAAGVEVGEPGWAAGQLAAGDASYDEDWDREPDWEQQVTESRSWDSHTGCDRDARRDHDLALSDHTPHRTADTVYSGCRHRLLAVLPATHLLLHVVCVCFPASWTLPLATVLTPVVAARNYR